MSKKIIIVDDFSLIRSVAQKAAISAGFESINSSNGQEGLDVLKTDSIDIVFCDINIPVMGGFKMVAEVKKDEKLKYISIVMLTTESNPELKEKSRALGVKAWLLKPFNEDKFLIALEKLIG